MWTAIAQTLWSYGVMVSTLDSESSDPGSNPGRTSFSPNNTWRHLVHMSTFLLFFVDAHGLSFVEEQVSRSDGLKVCDVMCCFLLPFLQKSIGDQQIWLNEQDTRFERHGREVRRRLS